MGIVGFSAEGCVACPLMPDTTLTASVIVWHNKYIVNYNNIMYL
jgi:hypothetical protein